MSAPEDDFINQLTAKIRPALLDGIPDELSPSTIASIAERVAAARSIPRSVLTGSKAVATRVARSTEVDILGTAPPERVARPRLWGDVPSRDPNFTGREELLDSLRVHLAAGEGAGPRVTVLCGMAGVGKTHLAAEYAHRFLHSYKVVWWVRADQTGHVRASLFELARRLGVPGRPEPPETVPAMLEALRTRKPRRRWLLVFDAAEDVDLIHQFLPAGGPCEILVTSRNPAWSSVCLSVEVAPFRRVESLALLRRRGIESDCADADRLADRVGDLPLAVAQAAAWLSESGMPVAEYLRVFDERPWELLDTPAPPGYGRSVLAVLRAAFDDLLSGNRAAHQLLLACAFLAPDWIPRELFTKVQEKQIVPELDGALRDPMELARAVWDINRRGLVTIDYAGNRLRLHRLVLLALRERTTRALRSDLRLRAQQLWAGYDPNDPGSPRQWPRYLNIRQHVDLAELVDCDDARVRRLAINLMRFQYFRGEYEEAIFLARQALDRWTERLGESDPQVLEAGSALGLCLWVVGRYPEAADVNRKMMDLRCRMFGENSRDTITAELRIAVDLRSRGEFSAALELNERIREKAKRLYGETDPTALQAAHDLAVSVRLCGDYRRAFELNQRTSQLRAEVLGPDSMDTLNTVSGMIMDRRELGDYALAHTEHERIARRVRDLVGEDSAEALRRFAYLAVARRKAGDHAGAVAISHRTLLLYHQRYGPEHPPAMSCAMDHSNNLRHMGNLDSARELGEEVLERYQRKLGDGHPHTLAAAANLAVTLRACGELDQARRLNERTCDRLNDSLGADHPHAIACAINLASDLADLGEPDEAVRVGTEARDRSERTLGHDHPTTLAATLNLALDLRAAGRSQEADRLFDDVVARFRQVLGEHHPATIAAVTGSRAHCDIDPLPL